MSSPTFKERFGVTEMADKSKMFWKALAAEFLGNLLLNFFGCASCVNVADPKAPADIIRVSFAFGLVIFILVQTFAHVSGGHLNPAVTFSFLITGKIPILRAFFYVIAQCVGSIAGSALLKSLTPDDPKIQENLGVAMLSPKLSALQGFGIEFFLGYVLVLVVFAVCDPNRPMAHIMGPLAIGIAVGVGHLATMPLTGSSMNPARSLGSAVVANSWKDHWAYWLGPIFGGMVAACTYQCVFTAPKKTPADEYSPVHPDDREMTLQTRK